MVWLIIGLVLFLGAHSVSIVSRGARDNLMQRLGEGPWKGLYSLLAAAGLVMIVVGYAAARVQPVVLYQPPVWTRHLALLLMLPSIVLLVAAYTNGHIRRVTKHPMLLATKLWATAHLLANGTLADVLLFGAFLLWAVADRIALKRRTPVVQPGAAAQPAKPKVANDLIALALGLAVYAWLVVQGHAWLIGVSPIGR